MGAHKDRLIQAAELLNMTPDDLLTRLESWQGTPDDPTTGEAQDRGPAPEGFQVFAHWSVSHAGINIEIDAPEGLPLTIHVNDWRAVAEVIGSDGEFPWKDDEDDASDETWRAPGEHLPECTRASVYGHPGECIAEATR